MSTQKPAALSAAKDASARAALLSEMTDIAEKVIAEKGKHVFGTFTEAQKSIMEELLSVARKTERNTRPYHEKGLMFSRCVRAMALGATTSNGRGDPEAAIFAVKKYWGDDDPVIKGLEEATRFKAGGLTAGAAQAGGNIVIPEWSREWIELLRNYTVVRRMQGINVIPMPVGAITMRKQSAAGTAFYIGEASNISKSQQQVNLANLVFKKLAALTVVSNDLLRFAGTEADAFVRNDLLLVSAIREDLAFLLGDGTLGTPIGIYNWLNTTNNKFTSAGTSLANQQSDVAKLIKALQQGNVPLIPGPATMEGNGPSGNGYFIMAPRTYWGLYNLVSTTGQFIFRDELSKFMFYGYNVLVTNQIPINANANGNNDSSGAASFLFFVHAPSILIGDALTVQIDVFPNGAYYDGTNVISGISTDETVIRVLREHDFMLRHDVGASVVYNETVQ